MEEELQKRNLKLLVHHLIQAKESFERYVEAGGDKDDFSEARYIEYGRCDDFDVEEAHLDSIFEEAIHEVNKRLKLVE